MKRILAFVMLGMLQFVRSNVGTDLLRGAKQPNDLFMPYLGGVVVFKNTFDLIDPVRGSF